MTTYSLNDLLTATGGTCPAMTGEVRGISIDTRNIEAGNLYIALKGERLDGHAFVTDALATGAAFALVEALVLGVPESQQIVVPDTLRALQALARFARNRAPYRVIGVTGSVGKTSTKDMLSLALSSHARTHATRGNYNNHIGLPLTLLNTPTGTECLVLEMGMNHAGEIALLSEIARPDAAIITTVEAVHLEFFDSVEGIARAKAEMVEGMAAGAPIILPYDNPYFSLLKEIATTHGQRVVSFGQDVRADYSVREVCVTKEGTHAELMAESTLMQIALQVLGAHHALNAASVLACCDALGVNLAKAAAALHHYHEPKGRGTLIIVPWQGGAVTVIDETYNASPASMRSAFSRVAAISNGARVIAVLGDMLELGDTAPALHAELAEPLAEAGIEHVYSVGSLMLHLAHVRKGASYSAHFHSNTALVDSLIHELKAGDIVLCKGSRGSRMEEVIAAISKVA
jgi:UDP-N-acetylmuramoyl-tripeptide--D-alanyl-D-alanine ligase